MNRTQKVVGLITSVVIACAIIMSILFTPASLIFLAMGIWMLFVLGEGDVGNPYKRGRLIYIVDNKNIKSQMTDESNKAVEGGYFGLKIYIGLLGALMFIIGIVYIILFIE